MKRLANLFLPIVFLLQIITACRPIIGSDTDLTTHTPEPVQTPLLQSTPTPLIVSGTVRLWHPWEEFERSALFGIIADFQKIYPEAAFDVTYVPALDLCQAFEASFADGSEPSLLVGPAEWGPSLFDKQWVADLSSLADQDFLNTLNSAGVESGRYQNTLVSLPLNLKGVVLFRNQSIVTQAPATFDELVQLSNAANQGQLVGAILERSFFFSGGHLIGLGGELMTSQGDPAFNEKNYRAGIAWMDLMKSFEKAGATEYMTDNDLNLFKEGRVGFIIDGTWNLFTLADAVDPLNLVIDPWPSLQDGHLAGFIQAESLYLTPKALQEEHQVSWLFAKWMLSPDSQAALANVNLIPSASAAPDVGAIGKIGNPFITQVMRAFQDGAAYPLLPEMTAYTNQLEIALQRVLFQDADARSALQAAFEGVLVDLVNIRAMQTPTP